MPFTTYLGVAQDDSLNGLSDSIPEFLPPFDRRRRLATAHQQHSGDFERRAC
jgi:hypothetical protein